MPSHITELIPDSRLLSILAESSSSDLALRLVDCVGASLAQSNLAGTGPVEDATWEFEALVAEIDRATAHAVLEKNPDGDWPICGMALLMEEQTVGYLLGRGRGPIHHIRQVVYLTGRRIEDLLLLNQELDSHAEEIVRNYDEIALLYGVSHTLGGVLRIDEACELVLEQAMLAIGAEKASIMLLDHETDELYVSTAQGIPVEHLPQIRVKLGEGICGWVAEQGEPLLVNDIQNLNLPARNHSDRYRTESFLSFPLIASPMKVKREVVGVINMTDKRSGEIFSAGDLKLLNAIATQAAVAIANARLYDELEKQFFDTVEALASAIDARDPYTHGHSRRVTHYAIAIGRLLGMNEDDLESVRLAALLHDIGKIGTPEHILLKSGKLNDAEWKEMRLHPECGAEIIQHIRRLKKPVIDGVRHHHERLDGSGYPGAIDDIHIPTVARIISVADAFDAMTSDRPYRNAMTGEEAISELRRCIYSQFDSQVVNALIHTREEEKELSQE